MPDVCIEEVWRLAQRYAPGIMRKYHVRLEKYAEDDLVSDFVKKFIEGKFDEKFDPSIRSLESYVHRGMVFHAISHLRRKDPAKLADSADAVGASVSWNDLVNPTTPEAVMSLVEELVGMVPDRRFGYGVVVVVNNEQFQSTTKSLAKLAMMGYSKSDLAELFKVTPSRVGQLLKESFRGITREMVVA